jgi:hypothetical protein
MEWVPLLTFVQVAVDAMNAMRVVPGEFKSFGHDYRGDTAEFVHAAYHLDPVSDEQMRKVGEVLTQLELERGERIKAAKEASTKDADGARKTRGPRYLRDRKPGDPKTDPIIATPGVAAGDYQ